MSLLFSILCQKLSILRFNPGRNHSHERRGFGQGGSHMPHPARVYASSIEEGRITLQQLLNNYSTIRIEYRVSFEIIRKCYQFYY